jgi:hypothetical protein
MQSVQGRLAARLVYVQIRGNRLAHCEEQKRLDLPLLLGKKATRKIALSQRK